jgi:Ca2+-transporting ATPase
MSEEARKWHSLPPSSVADALNTDIEKGLSTEEALRRKEVYGPNRLVVERHVSPLKIFARQFVNLMIVILLIATAISALLGEIVDAVVIFVIVFLASVLGFWHEFRSERIVSALRKMMVPSCSVVRDGVVVKVNSEDVVPGDILVIEEGDRVVADGRIVEAYSLETYEAALTGESTPVQKRPNPLPAETPLPDRTNMVYSGTTVARGKGRAIVVATGMNTEFGKIAKEVMEIEEERPPLERRMNEVAKNLGKIVVALVAVIVLIDLGEFAFLGQPITGEAFIKIFMFAVSLAVAAVPEALPAIVTSTLAVGMWILAKRNAVVRSMAAVETLGSTEVICSDKTGTITLGEMIVRRVYVSGSLLEVGSGGVVKPVEKQLVFSNPLQSDFSRLVETFVLASDAVAKKEGGKLAVYGDPTEAAIVFFAEQVGVNTSELRAVRRRVWEIPFSSERKRMTTVTYYNDMYEAHLKGALEVVIELSDKILVEGVEHDLTPEWREAVLRAGELMAAQGFRVLAAGRRVLGTKGVEQDEEAVERGFTFLGFVGIADPPRPEAAEAVAKCVEAGMKPVMVTGDHLSTAVAIAREVGIYREGDIAVHGAELEKLSDEELDKKVEKISVYARVTPHHKLRIVDAWRRRSKTVAMTGDGINDAPALKKADIGVAMGIKGTEVAKEASDLILLDDNFASIVKAVELGRWIYDNIKKYLAYLLQANLVEIAVISLSALVILPLLGYRGEELLPLLPVQILYINLATDGLPAIALGFSPPDHDLMRRPPRPRNEPVFTAEVKHFIIRALIVESPVLLLGFLTALPYGMEAARSRLFLMFIAVELVVALNCRSLIHSILQARPHKVLLLAILWELVLITALTIIPVTREALHITIPTLEDLAWITLAGLITFTSIELLKRVDIEKMFSRPRAAETAARAAEVVK